MNGLRCVATLAPLGEEMVLTDGYLHLDALLAAVVARRNHWPTPASTEELRPIDLPVDLEASGRFHLASASISVAEERGLRFLQRRYPLSLAQRLAGPGLRRISLDGGPQRNQRLPMETLRVAGGQLTWFASGDRGAVEDLLADVTHLGRRRGVGLGAVARWEVDECAPWPGFPVLAPDGTALRHLPPDWPGLGTHEPRYGCLSYPYWMKARETLIAAPPRAMEGT